MFDLDRFQQVRWVQGGREFPHLDCYGVVNEVRRQLSLPLWPEYAGISKEDGGLAASAASHAGTARPSAPIPGAVAFCYEGGAVSHVAVVVAIDDRLQVLECNPKRNVSIQSLSRLMRRFVRVEFYS